MPRVVPFQVSLQEAQESFENWQQSHWLAPGRLLRKGLGSMHAALLPFWIFEATVQVEYAGNRACPDPGNADVTRCHALRAPVADCCCATWIFNGFLE